MFKFAETFPAQFAGPSFESQRAFDEHWREVSVRQVRPVPRRDGPVRPALRRLASRSRTSRRAGRSTARRTRRTTRSSASTRSWPPCSTRRWRRSGEALPRPVRRSRRRRSSGRRTSCRQGRTRGAHGRDRRGDGLPATPGDPFASVFLPPPVPAYQASGRLTEIPEDGLIRRAAHAFALAKAR